MTIRDVEENLCEINTEWKVPTERDMCVREGKSYIYMVNRKIGVDFKQESECTE
jgi:hypothetical protein